MGVHPLQPVLRTGSARRPEQVTVGLVRFLTTCEGGGCRASLCPCWTSQPGWERPLQWEHASSRLLLGDQIHPSVPSTGWASPLLSASLLRAPAPEQAAGPSLKSTFRMSLLEVQTWWISRQDLASPEKEIIVSLNFLALLLLKAEDASFLLYFSTELSPDSPSQGNPRGFSFPRAQFCICCYWISWDPWQLPSPAWLILPKEQPRTPVCFPLPAASGDTCTLDGTSAHIPSRPQVTDRDIKQDRFWDRSQYHTCDMQSKIHHPQPSETPPGFISSQLSTHPGLSILTWMLASLPLFKGVFSCTDVT